MRGKLVHFPGSAGINQSIRKGFAGASWKPSSSWLAVFAKPSFNFITHFLLILWFMFYSLFAKSCVWSKVPTQTWDTKVTCTPPVSGFESHQSRPIPSQSPASVALQSVWSVKPHCPACNTWRPWESNNGNKTRIHFCPKTPRAWWWCLLRDLFPTWHQGGSAGDLWLIYGCCSVARVFRNIWMLELETVMVKLKKRWYSMHHQLKWVTGPLIAPKSLRRFDFDVCAEA